MTMKTALLCAAAVCAGLSQPALADRAGVTAAVNQDAFGTPPGRAVRTIVLGSDVVQNERIETSGEGLVQILLADGTAFTVGPNSSLTIDRFVYDPDGGTAEIAASLGRGVFRFIGGRTSKTPGGVNLATPVGTVGIRGGVADIVLEPAGSEVEARISLVFGDELTLAGGGSAERLYQSGYSILVGRNGETDVVRTTAADANRIQQALAGRAGTSGGAARSPTNEDIERSAIPGSNSRQAFALISPPLPTPRPLSPAEVDVALVSERRPGDVAVTPANPSPGPGFEPGPNPGGDPGPGQPGGTVAARILTSPLEVAGNGIVGGNGDADQRIDLSITRQSSSVAYARGAINQGTITLPFRDGPTEGLERRPVVAGVGATFQPGGQDPITLTGTAYLGTEGFAAYFLEGTDRRPYYAILGTQSPVGETFTGVRRQYSLTADPRLGLATTSGEAIPFFLDRLPDTATDDALVSPVLVQGNPGGAGAQLFHNWITIEGKGGQQVSAVGLTVGDIENNRLRTARAGSYRIGAGGVAFHMGGAVATVGGPDATGSDFFGSNAQNFILSSAFDDPQNPGDVERMSDRPGGLNTGSGGQAGGQDPASTTFSTIHVAQLQSETAASVPTLQGIRYGFAAGDVESAGLGLLRTQDPSTTNLQFDPDNSLTARVVLASEIGDSDLAVSIDDHSAVISNAIFGATGEIDESLPNTVPQATSYLVSARAQENLQELGIFQRGGNTVQLCECEFLEWGWWGTRQDQGGRGDFSDSARSVHLGTFATGDITSIDQLDRLADTAMTATYRGHAIGNVQSGGNRYLAAGGLEMGWNFGSRTGSIAITNIDGRTLSGDLGENGFDGARFSGFGGAMQVDGASMTGGSVSGAFVNGAAPSLAGDLAKGVIGSFDATENDNWAVTGTFVGQR